MWKLAFGDLWTALNMEELGGIELADTKLFCHTTLIMKPDAIQGHDYTVLDETENEITIRNEHGEMHHFSKNPSSEAYFGKWFFRID